MLRFQSTTYPFINRERLATIPLHVKVLPAKFTLEHIAEMHALAPVEVYDPTAYEQTPNGASSIHLGDPFDAREWEENRADGERCYSVE